MFHATFLQCCPIWWLMTPMQLLFLHVKQQQNKYKQQEKKKKNNQLWHVIILRMVLNENPQLFCSVIYH